MLIIQKGHPATQRKGWTTAPKSPVRALRRVSEQYDSRQLDVKSSPERAGRSSNSKAYGDMAQAVVLKGTCTYRSIHRRFHLDIRGSTARTSNSEASSWCTHAVSTLEIRAHTRSYTDVKLECSFRYPRLDHAEGADSFLHGWRGQMNEMNGD